MAQNPIKYRTILTGKFFVDVRKGGLSDREECLANYLLQGPEMGNRIGLWPYNLPGIAHAKKWPQDTLAQRNELKKNLLNVFRCFDWLYDDEAEVMFVHSHFYYNPIHHGLQLIGCLKDLLPLPRTPLMHTWAANAKTLIKKETQPKKTKDNPNPKPTNLHAIFDSIVGPILAKIPKPDGAPAPVPKAPAAKPKPKDPEPEPKADRFRDFWDVWPKKDGKKDAKKAWKALKPNDALIGRIVSDVSKRAPSEDWTKEKKKYCPLPASYLRGARWEDQALTAGPKREPTIFEEGE